MAARHGKLGEFQQGIDQVEDYQERFVLYCAATKLAGDDAAETRKAVLLMCICSPTYALLKNLVRPAKPQEKSIDELFQLLKDHYERKVNVIAEQFCFCKRQQRDRESIAVYVSELQRISKNCQFGEQLCTALRDQLVCGLFQETVQQKLLAEADLTLEKAIRIAQAAEMAWMETQTLREGGMTGPAPKQATSTAFRIKKTSGSKYSQPGGSNRVCYRCNESSHHAVKCRFKSHTCHYCKTKGHIMKACRKKAS